MSTNSSIAMKNDDGTYRWVYCHWDGYPDWNGRILLQNYNDESKVKALLDLGDISSLRETLEDTVFYQRDRGESGKDLEAKTSLIGEHRNRFDWNYVWDNGQWFVNGHPLEAYRDKWQGMTVE